MQDFACLADGAEVTARRVEDDHRLSFRCGGERQCHMVPALPACWSTNVSKAFGQFGNEQLRLLERRESARSMCSLIPSGW